MNRIATPGSHVAAQPVYEPFLAEDDSLHEHGTHPWSTETWWFSFFAPERNLGGWLYGLARPNQSTSAGGAWIWDRSGAEPRQARYFAHYTALPTRMTNLRAPVVRFPSRLEVAVERPGERYRLGFTDPESGLDIDLRFTATMPAVGHKENVPPFEESAHYDQAGRVTGTVVLGGETLDLDCFALRDRSWGLRSERVVPNFSYCWMANEAEAFLVYAPRVTGPLQISRGVLHRDGVSRPIVDGLRREERDPVNGWVTALAVTAIDDLGRTIEAEAQATSRLVHPRPTSANTISVLSWTHDGSSSWGEDQDVWPHEVWKRWFREVSRARGG
jgi:hypothetical protein